MVARKRGRLNTGITLFERAYSIGDKRVEKGHGWPIKKVSNDVKHLASFLIANIKGRKVLDLGSGDGRNSIFLAKKGFDCYGIDYVSQAVERATQFAAKQRVGDRTHFEKGNVLDLPYPKDFFDVAIDWSCFDHIRKSHWKLYMKELLRVLKREGIYYLAAFSKETPHAKIMKHNWLVFRGGYDYYFTKREIREIFSPHFRILSIQEMQEHGWRPPFFMFLGVLMEKMQQHAPPLGRFLDI